MNLKINYDISTLDIDSWEKYSENENFFTNYNFLKHFSENHKNFEHLFVLNGKNRFYGNIFNVKVKGLSDYSSNFILKSLLGLFNFNFFYLTNSFITNVNSFDVNEDFDAGDIVSKVTNERKIDFVVIPDFLFENDRNINRSKDFIKIEVEEEMILSISNTWKEFNSYKSDLKTKYRKKINNIFKNSSPLKIKLLEISDIVKYRSEMQNLYDNVTSNSKFQGPKFNVDIFQCLIKDFNNFNIYGYFLDNQILAFSSEFSNNQTLYSYFVGINYEFNKQYSIYERILCESISNAIAQKKKKLIFGRTANEFKSNFGAIPEKSYVYFKAQNKFMALLLRRFLSKIKPKIWVQRNPFRKNI